ncbi:hypothetical protein PG993_005418 [Apiospora rasikravindrae]|uniref:FAD dependent oxidoreductase domain-containing protein n=1 Tax=Apiospora rasikravindrae TaxID=990691 RepID=A0ABR1TI14_9PEZI
MPALLKGFLRKVLITRGGVTGLVTAWTLLDKSYHITIVAKEWASYGSSRRLTPKIAGALWEFPPAVCGQHKDAILLQNSRRWCMTPKMLETMASDVSGFRRIASITDEQRVGSSSAPLTPTSTHRAGWRQLALPDTVIKDGRDIPKIDATLSANEIVSLVPRNDDVLLIGGTPSRTNRASPTST